MGRKKEVQRPLGNFAWIAFESDGFLGSPVPAVPALALSICALHRCSLLYPAGPSPWRLPAGVSGTEGSVATSRVGGAPLGLWASEQPEAVGRSLELRGRLGVEFGQGRHPWEPMFNSLPLSQLLFST